MDLVKDSIVELYGLRVQCDLPLAGRVVDGAPDLFIRVGEPRSCRPSEAKSEAEIDTSEARQPPAFDVLEDGTWRVRFNDNAEALFNPDLRQVVIHGDPSASPGILEVLTAGPVLAFWLALKGIACLHASAVATRNSATAFAGVSGAGKSTLAGLCCSLGATLVTDDILRIDLSGNEPLCVPGSRELRLRSGADRLAATLECHPQRKTADGRTAVLAGPSSIEPVRLGAVIVPVLGSHVTAIRRMRGGEAIQALLAAARIDSRGPPSMSVHALDLATSVAATVPVWELRIERESISPQLLPKVLIDVIGLMI